MAWTGTAPARCVGGRRRCFVHDVATVGRFDIVYLEYNPPVVPAACRRHFRSAAGNKNDWPVIARGSCAVRAPPQLSPMKTTRASRPW
jgi:hypothetical protein